MLLHCNHLKHRVYDDLRHNINNIYGIDMSYNDDIIMNAIPIKYNKNYWIMSTLGGLEISSLELYNQSYEIKYIVNEEIHGNISINKVCSLHEIESGIDYKTVDCFYDEHLNIMFINFQDIRIEYIDISDYSFDYFENFENNSINFYWLNNLLKKKNIASVNNKIVFEDEFINLPSIPYIVSDTLLINELIDCPMLEYPCTGARLFNDSGILRGIVSYVNKNNIISIPINLIKKSLDYLNLIPIYNMNINFTPIKIKIKSPLTVNTTEYGLYFNKKNKKNDIIMTIDNYPICPNGNLLIKQYSIPLSTYLWLFKKEDTIRIKGIVSSILNNVCINKDDDIYSIDLSLCENIKYSYYSTKLFSNTTSALSVSKLNYIEYNKKYLVEINERIMQILKILFQSTDNYDKIYDYIYEKKYSKNRIVIIIDTRINIKIIKNIKNNTVKNINTIKNLYDDKKLLKDYINSI